MHLSQAEQQTAPIVLPGPTPDDHQRNTKLKVEPGLRSVPAFYWVLKACSYWPSPQVPHFGEMMWGAHMALFFLSFSWVYKMGNMVKKAHMGLQN